MQKIDWQVLPEPGWRAGGVPGIRDAVKQLSLRCHIVYPMLLAGKYYYSRAWRFSKTTNLAIHCRNHQKQWLKWFNFNLLLLMVILIIAIAGITAGDSF